jgi:hypothetical protein
LIIGLRFVGWDVLCLLIFPTAKKCLDALCPTEHSIPGRPIYSDRPRSRARAESCPDTEPPGPGPVHEARPDTDAPGPGPVRTTRRHLASVCVLLHPPWYRAPFRIRPE